MCDAWGGKEELLGGGRQALLVIFRKFGGKLEGDKQLERSMCVWERLNIIVKLCVNKCFMICMLLSYAVSCLGMLGCKWVN